MVNNMVSGLWQLNTICRSKKCQVLPLMESLQVPSHLAPFVGAGPMVHKGRVDQGVAGLGLQNPDSRMV